jgi:hypothetical protein
MTERPTEEDEPDLADVVDAPLIGLHHGGEPRRGEVGDVATRPVVLVGEVARRLEPSS